MQYFYLFLYSFLDLFDSDTDLGNALLTNPEESLRDWNKSVIDVQVHIQKTLNHGCIKSKTNCRIYNLPPWPHVCRTLFPGNEDANKFLQVSGKFNFYILTILLFWYFVTRLKMIY